MASVSLICENGNVNTKGNGDFTVNLNFAELCGERAVWEDLTHK